MKRAELTGWLTNNGWKYDRWGDSVKEASTGFTRGVIMKFRVKLNPTSARLEVNINKEWRKIASDYYKNIAFDENGTPVIGTRKFF